MRPFALAAWRLRGLALLAFAACVDDRAPLTGPIAAASPTLVVRVVDAASGRPLTGAHVILTAPGVGTLTAATVRAAGVSGADGSVTIDSLPAGRYRVHLRRIGYERDVRDFVLRGEALAPSALTVAVRAAPICTGSISIVQESR